MRRLRPRSARRRAEINARIAREIDSLAPVLRIAGAVQLQRFDVEEGVAYVEISGACPDCQVSAATFVRGIEAHLRRRIPEISAVRAVAAAPRP